MAYAKTPEGHEILARLECGCMITTDGEDLHIWPCSPAHDEKMSPAAAEAAAANKIPFTEVRDQGRA